MFGGGAGQRQKGVQFYAPTSQIEQAVSTTIDTSLQLSAVWACVKILTESIAALPLNFYRVNEDGTRVKITSDESPVVRLFNGKVNGIQHRQEFLETLLYQYFLYGNAYAAINRRGDEVASLLPLMTRQMEVTLPNDNITTVVYRYTNGVDLRVYSQKNIIHLRSFGTGAMGLSTMEYAKSSIASGLAIERSVTSIYKNGGKPSGLLFIDKKITPEQRAAIREQYADMNLGNANRLFIFEAGMSYEAASLSPQDIELLAARRYQVEDIARFFGVPSVLINDSSATTSWGSGIQQIVQGFYRLGLRPTIEKIEATLKFALFPPEEWSSIELEFDFKQLTMPDIKDRIDMYSKAIQGGHMTPNETRLEEGRNPMEGADTLIVQKQMRDINGGGDEE